MHYSKELVSRFKGQYEKSFGLEISLEVADLELYRLARLLEILRLSIFNEEEKEYEDD